MLKKLLMRYMLIHGWMSLTSSIIVASTMNSLEAYSDAMYTMSDIMSSSSSSSESVTVSSSNKCRRDDYDDKYLDQVCPSLILL